MFVWFFPAATLKCGSNLVLIHFRRNHSLSRNWYLFKMKTLPILYHIEMVSSFGRRILIKFPVWYSKLGVILSIFHFPSTCTKRCSAQLRPLLVSVILFLVSLTPFLRSSSALRPWLASCCHSTMISFSVTDLKYGWPNKCWVARGSRPRWSSDSQRSANSHALYTLVPHAATTRV